MKWSNFCQRVVDDDDDDDEVDSDRDRGNMKATSPSYYYSFPSIIKTYLQSAQSAFAFESPTLPSSFIPRQPFVLATNLIVSYLERGLIGEARSLFDEIPDRDVVSWTAMIAGYSSCNEYALAWDMFCNMLKNEAHPNAFTLSSVLKACKGMRDLSSGAAVHALAIKRGMYEGSIYVDNALVDMYAACGASMSDACLVFHGIPVKNAVSWTTLIAGYTHRGQSHDGLQIFRQMMLEGAVLDPYSFSIAIIACASISSLNYGRQLRAAIVKLGFQSNLPVMNSLLHMYCRCGCLSDANQFFHEMNEKNLITWNTLIAGYERLDSTEALFIFSQMESKGFSPNCFTLTSVIAACANLTALSCGQQIHGGIVRRGLNGNLRLANALIDMYAKCGSINDSHKIFNKLSYKCLVSWTSMMIGFGTHGYGEEAVELFNEMVRSGIIPDQIVFMAVLSACSHAGLVDQGLRYFDSMVSDYKIEPNQEICGCVVDLLGRAGRVEEAYQLIQSMPFKPDETVWGALLGACKAHEFPSLGKLAAQRLIDLRPNLVTPYVALSNIYAAEGKWGDFARTRRLLNRIGSKKETGSSWIEVRDQVYSFVVGDKMGCRIECVYDILKLLIHHMKEIGCVPYTECLIHDPEDGT